MSGSSSAFQSTPSAWRETQERQQLIISTLFQSTPSAWRETEPEEEPEEEPDISIHSLRMEGDGNALPQIISAILFQSTPSAWRETQGERHSGQCGHISIHSLRMEGDITSSLSLLLDRDFNPLPPHGGRPCRRTGSHSPLYHFNPLPPHGGRPLLTVSWTVSLVFQSTPSAWRETGGSLFEVVDDRHFNPLPPHGGRRTHSVSAASSVTISIHSLRMEGDSKTAQESVFHFAYPCTILQKRMQKTTFCTRKNGFFRKKGEKFGAKPSASFCAPMIRTDTFPLNFSHRISGSSMSMVSFAPICSTFD